MATIKKKFPTYATILKKMSTVNSVDPFGKNW
jgi:hypothetical protein